MKRLKTIMQQSLFVITQDHDQNMENVKLNEENKKAAEPAWKNTKQQMLRKQSMQ